MKSLWGALPLLVHVAVVNIFICTYCKFTYCKYTPQVCTPPFLISKQKKKDYYSSWNLFTYERTKIVIMVWKCLDSVYTFSKISKIVIYCCEYWHYQIFPSFVKCFRKFSNTLKLLNHFCCNDLLSMNRGSFHNKTINLTSDLEVARLKQI